DSLAQTLPTRFINVEDLFPGKGLLDFLTAGFKGLGDFLVKIAYRTKRNVDTKQCLSDFLTAPSGYPVQGGEISQHGGKSGAKIGSCMGRMSTQAVAPQEHSTHRSLYSVTTGLIIGISVTLEERPKSVNHEIFEI
ncbi:MAG: hypothetical protein WCP72_12390, partial [Desulfomonile sp.]